MHTDSGALQEAIALSMDDWRRQILIESAGLFWIGAELGILFAVWVGRRRLQTGPPFVPRLFAPEKRALAAGAAVFALLSAAILARHWMLEQPHAYLLEGLALDGAQFEQRFLDRTREHLAVWSAFVVAWVALECAIVWQGVRGFLLLRARLLRDPERASP